MILLKNLFIFINDNFKRISLEMLKERETKNSLSVKDYALWDFMVTASIESMNYKDGEKDSICIKLNTVMFRDP